MSNKQIISVLAVLVVLAALFGFWASFTKPTTTTEPTAGERSEVLGGTLGSDDNYHFEESGAGYVIEATYPAQVPLANNEASLKAARAIETKLAEGVAVFKTDLSTMLTAEEIARLEQMGASYALGFEYEDYASARYHSYVYQVYQDTGGAHPNAFYLTMVFDQDGNLVPLEALFAQGSGYLPRLSELVYPKVVAELGARAGSAPTPEMLETARVGTAPSPEALQFYYITDTDLHLLFPPYQVAAYAMGSFDIAIPLSSLPLVDSH